MDVALVSETHLKPCNRANIANFELYRTDRLTGAKGGTAVYIKKSLEHQQVGNPNNLQIESTIVKIYTQQGNLIMASCDNPPSSMLQESDFDILDNLGDKLIIAGDFNAKHTRINCNRSNTNGYRLIKYTDDRDAYATGTLLSISRLLQHTFHVN